MNKNENEYPIGYKYKTRHKNPRECTIVDILKTYNSKNELVKIRYVATHLFMNQIITDYDVVAASIAMGECNYE